MAQIFKKKLPVIQWSNSFGLVQTHGIGDYQLDFLRVVYLDWWSGGPTIRCKVCTPCPMDHHCVSVCVLCAWKEYVEIIQCRPFLSISMHTPSGAHCHPSKWTTQGLHELHQSHFYTYYNVLHYWIDGPFFSKGETLCWSRGWDVEVGPILVRR